jgi:hypothetical protein
MLHVYRDNITTSVTLSDTLRGFSSSVLYITIRKRIMTCANTTYYRAKLRQSPPVLSAGAVLGSAAAVLFAASSFTERVKIIYRLQEIQ